MFPSRFSPLSFTFLITSSCCALFCNGLVAPEWMHSTPNIHITIVDGNAHSSAFFFFNGNELKFCAECGWKLDYCDFTIAGKVQVELITLMVTLFQQLLQQSNKCYLLRLCRTSQNAVKKVCPTKVSRHNFYPFHA